MSADPHLKVLQPYPQSPGQVQKPQSGPNPVSNPVVKLVSGYPRARSHSPRCRIDVEIEPEDQGGWQKGMRPAVSHESFMVPSDWKVTTFDPAVPLSQSFPDSALHSALPRQRNSYSPASNRGNFLQVPDNNHCLFPTSDPNRRGWIGGHNAVRGSSSMSDLSASAPADILKYNLAEVRKMSSQSSQCWPSSSPTTPSPWLCVSPSTSPKTSACSSPTSPSSWSISTLSPPFSPDNPVSNSVPESQCIHTHLFLPDHASFPLLISPACSPHRSPCGSPFGSQGQICIRSVGMEC